MSRNIALFLSGTIVAWAAWALSAPAQDDDRGPATQTESTGAKESESTGPKQSAGPSASDDKPPREKVRLQLRPTPYREVIERVDILNRDVELVIEEVRDAGVPKGQGWVELSGRVRKAVEAAYEARRALQQAELEDLERRVERIKHALAARDERKAAIIDERTSELLDDIQHGDWQKLKALQDAWRPLAERAAGEPMNPNKGRIGGVTAGGQSEGAENVPQGFPNADAATQERLLQLDVTAAELNLADAKKVFERNQALRTTGAITQADLDLSESQVKNAELVLERAQVKLKAFQRQGVKRRPETSAEAAGGRGSVSIGGQGVVEHVPHGLPDEADRAMEAALLKLDVTVAQRNLTAARKVVDAFQASPNAITPRELQSSESQLKDAELALERAQVKLEAFKAAETQAADLEERLLQLDVEEKRLTVETEIEQAEQNLSSAENQLAYTKKMASNGFVTPLELKSKESLVLQAKLNLDVAGAKLQLRRAEAKLEHYRRQHGVSPTKKAASEQNEDVHNTP